MGRVGVIAGIVVVEFADQGEELGDVELALPILGSDCRDDLLIRIRRTDLRGQGQSFLLVRFHAGTAGSSGDELVGDILAVAGNESPVVDARGGDCTVARPTGSSTDRTSRKRQTSCPSLTYQLSSLLPLPPSPQ